MCIYVCVYVYGTAACSLLIPRPEFKPASPGLKLSLNHWTTREVPQIIFLFLKKLIDILKCSPRILCPLYINGSKNCSLSISTDPSQYLMLLL